MTLPVDALYQYWLCEVLWDMKLCEILWDMYRVLQAVDPHLNAPLPALVVLQLIPAPGSSSVVILSLAL